VGSQWINSIVKKMVGSIESDPDSRAHYLHCHSGCGA
jgi:predicted trehalose synthase